MEVRIISKPSFCVIGKLGQGPYDCVGHSVVTGVYYFLQ